MKKTLIINGSPRLNGNTTALLNKLKSNLHGEITELSAFRSDISPCVDCRSCWKTGKCAVKDDMQIIYDDSFDNIVIASPIYFGTLPGQMLNLMSRLQPWHASVYFLKKPPAKSEKKAAVILTAGGKHNEKLAYHHLRAFFKMVNAHGYEEHIVYSGDTDTLPAENDTQAMEKLVETSSWLME